MHRTAGNQKVSGGGMVYLLEELGDARLRCEELKDYIKKATDLIEKSDKKDHIFEVAGHLLYGIPDTLFKLDKALQAVALVADRLDYEEIKDKLSPQKADILENVLQDVRLRVLKRRSGEDPMTPKQASEMLTHIASVTEKSGKVPLHKVMMLLAALENGLKNRRASVGSAQAVSAFRTTADDLASDRPPSPQVIASWLRKVLADQLTPTSAQMGAAIYQQSNSREEVMDGFKEMNPSLKEEDLREIADQWEANKDVVKDNNQQ